MDECPIEGVACLFFISFRLDRILEITFWVGGREKL